MKTINLPQNGCRAIHTWLRCLLAGGVIVFGGSVAKAADGSWEKLPNGVLGQPAIFEGVGGVKIAGYVRKPAGDGPFPIVIVLHGGGSKARDVQAETEDAKAGMMAAEAIRAGNELRPRCILLFLIFLQGWAVYAIDFRPSSHHIIDPIEFDDTVIALNKARAFPFVDPQRIAMWGGSHGGHVTGQMLSRFDLCCAVLCAPAGVDLIELSHLAAKGTPIGGNQMLIRQVEESAGVKMAEIEKHPETYHYSSLLTEVAKVRCPILMISGRNDNNAPLPVVNLYVDKLRAAGKEVETYQPDNGPHGFYSGIPQTLPETAESTRRAVAFIKKHFEMAGHLTAPTGVAEDRCAVAAADKHTFDLQSDTEHV